MFPQRPPPGLDTTRGAKATVIRTAWYRPKAGMTISGRELTFRKLLFHEAFQQLRKDDGHAH